MTVFSSLVTPQSLVFTTPDGRTHNVTSAHPNYARMKQTIGELKAALAAKSQMAPKIHDELARLVDVARVIAETGAGRIQVQSGVILFNGLPIANPVCDRILWGIRENIPMDSYIRFLDKLLDNPSRSAVKETYLFLEHNSMGLADDGDIIGYKKVRGDYMDIYSGTFDNSVGQTPEMARNDVDDNREVTCSQGLHFCSFGYLSSYGSRDDEDRVMIVKVNPRDIVAVPSDYKNAKVRCCRYEVVGEYKAEPTKRRDVLSDKAVWSRDQLALDAPKPMEFGEPGVCVLLNYRSAIGNESQREVFVNSISVKGNIYTLHCETFDDDEGEFVFRNYRSDRIRGFKDVQAGVVIDGERVGERVWEQLRTIDNAASLALAHKYANARRRAILAADDAEAEAMAPSKIDKAIEFNKTLRLSLDYNANAAFGLDGETKNYPQVFVERVEPGATGAPNLLCAILTGGPDVWQFRTFKAASIERVTDLDTATTLDMTGVDAVTRARMLLGFLRAIIGDETSVSMVQRFKIATDIVTASLPRADDTATTAALARMLDAAHAEGVALGKKDAGEGLPMHPDAHAHLYPGKDILQAFREAYVEAYLRADDDARPVHQDEIDESAMPMVVRRAMAKQNEPPMDEIMASIRRIISEE